MRLPLARPRGRKLSRFRIALAAGLGVAACALGAVGVGAAASQASPGAGVLKLRLGGSGSETRVVVELDRGASGRLVSGEGPSRTVVVALPHVDVSGEMSGQGSGLVRAWAVDRAGGAARVRLDLDRLAVVKRRFLLPPGDGYAAWRYVIDVAGAPNATALPRMATLSPAPPVKIGPEAAPAGPKVIVIDAGHGGKDPGAQGGGRVEKDVTLAAAKQLRDRLMRDGRYKVVLTRSTDRFVRLGERVRIARAANADLFISLHADAGTEASERGATVYTLSQQGADRVAEHVGDRGADWYMRVNLPGGDAQVNRILLDLTQREARNRSSVFAGQLLERISDRTVLMKQGHRSAGFVVLLAPEVPAVLLEMGFITNRQDQRALTDPAGRRRLMNAVGDSIDAYFTGGPKLASR